MTRKEIVDTQVLGKVVDLDEWFALLHQGYIGTQSGNTERIYFVGEKDEGIIYAKTLHSSNHYVKPSFERVPYAKLKCNLKRTRKLWIFAPKNILMPLVKEAIQDEQGQVFEIVDLSDRANAKEFNEELL